MALSFRAATEDDLDRLVEIHAAAYPDGRATEPRRRNFVANALGGLEHLFVAELDGDVVAHAFDFPLEAFFGKRAVRVGAIASVGVAPEVRGRGIARALLRQLHVISDVRGDAVTVLHAFRYGFYAPFAYAPTVSCKRLVFDPRSVPEGWRSAAQSGVRRARGADRDAIVRAYERAAPGATGWLHRPHAFWERLFANERRHLLVHDAGGELRGYVAFTLEQREAHAETTLLVDELVADEDEPEVRRALLGALGAMRDQVSEIVLEVGIDDPLEVALLDADRRRFGSAAVEHPVGEIVAGAMVRVEDVHRAIEARGYAEDGAFDVVVSDEIALSVRISDGRAAVGPARGGGALRTTRATLAAIFYGGIRARDAVRLGLADADERTIARIDAAVAMPAWVPVDRF